MEIAANTSFCQKNGGACLIELPCDTKLFPGESSVTAFDELLSKLRFDGQKQKIRTQFAEDASQPPGDVVWVHERSLEQQSLSEWKSQFDVAEYLANGGKLDTVNRGPQTGEADFLRAMDAGRVELSGDNSMNLQPDRAVLERVKQVAKETYWQLEVVPAHVNQFDSVSKATFHAAGHRAPYEEDVSAFHLLASLLFIYFSKFFLMFCLFAPQTRTQLLTEEAGGLFGSAGYDLIAQAHLSSRILDEPGVASLDGVDELASSSTSTDAGPSRVSVTTVDDDQPSVVTSPVAASAASPRSFVSSLSSGARSPADVHPAPAESTSSSATSRSSSAPSVASSSTGGDASTVATWKPWFPFFQALPGVFRLAYIYVSSVVCGTPFPTHVEGV